MLFVTTYNCPDVDGVACCIGYSEFLRKSGKKVIPTYHGEVSKEVKSVKKY